MLNLGLYGMDVMHKNMYDMPEFKKNLGQCGNLNDVRKLLDQDHEVNIKLLKESCDPTIALMKDIFS